MAEPMSSNEIEDVLSSIRRLVAQDLKPADRAKLAAVAAVSQKLVLAPEQRVEDTSSKFATVRRPSRRAAFPPVDMVLAGVAAAAEGSPRPEADEWPAPVSDVAPVFDVAPVPDVAETSASDLSDHSGEDFAAIAAEFDAAPRHMAPSPAEEPADFVLDPTARLYDAAPEEFTAPSFSQIEQTTWQESEPEIIQPQQFAMDADSATRETESLHGNIEPDSAWADEAERRVIEELSGKPAQQDGFGPNDTSFRDAKFGASSSQATPEILFDEDVLRAMVQAILRDEMAGAMGERITRNIRKLVRAEVGRMLAAQELE